MLFYRFCVSIRGLGTRLLCSSNMADLKGSALVILAEGAEEMEAVITTDVLRRGKVSWRIYQLKLFCLDIFDQPVGFYLNNYSSRPHGL